MDPDIALANLRRAVMAYAQALEPDSIEAAVAAADAIAAMVALDIWLSRGGFLPAAWKAKHNGCRGATPEEHENEP